MTGHHDPGDNPFDLGLPMAPTPTPTGKRRRRDRRPQRPLTPEDGLPPVAGGTHDGEWGQWLADSPQTGRDTARRPVIRPSNLFDDGDLDTETTAPRLIDRTGGQPGTPRRGRPEGSRRTRTAVIALIAAAGVATGGAMVVGAGVHSGRSRSAATPSVHATAAPDPAETSTTVSPPATADGCRTQRSADVVAGTEPGGTSSGPDTILAFQHGYYVHRSGAKAQDVLTEDATVTDIYGRHRALTGETIQAGISDTPPGTRYCVLITPADATAGSERWHVELTEQRPGQRPVVSAQTVTTRTVNGRTLITEITPAP
ncbi:hypothetical protein [Nocardia wallacei]|uniref:hypothetical protein n=1 Tax=Nocardia wallacei TaxID=480035 RepID=UPI0024537EA6|nr:hypothetical protein [Nocardia wallacei]